MGGEVNSTLMCRRRELLLTRVCLSQSPRLQGCSDECDTNTSRWHQVHPTEQVTCLICTGDHLRKFLPCTHTHTHTPSFFLWHVTHLCGPELHQYGLFLRLLVNPLLLQEPPVGMQPGARPWVLSQTRWSQKLPQSLSNTVGSPLLLCHAHKHRKVIHRQNINSWAQSEWQGMKCQKHKHILHARSGRGTLFQVWQARLEEVRNYIATGRLSFEGWV